MASLQPKTNKLGKRLAAHLLRRTTFYITPSRILEFADKTPQQAVAELVTNAPFFEPKGPTSISGDFWLTTGNNNNDNHGDRRSAVLLWHHNEVLKDSSIRHRMALYLKSIWVASAPDIDWNIFEHERLNHFYALGNIKTYAYKMTLDHQMLRFLDNNLNKKGQPNENYAREFLELFTILKGPQIAPGNYTNYTEDDIVEAARVLTGFTTSNFANKDTDTGLATGQAKFNNHDIGNKQFSSAFGNKIILGATSQADMYRELQEFVDMVFDQKETARAYTRRLYLFFVHDIITEEIEKYIIEPLATQLYNGGYEIKPVLETLLQSKHFYDEDDSDNTDHIIGGKIKSPLDLLFQSVNLFDADKMPATFASSESNGSRRDNLFKRTLTEIGFPEYPESVEGHPGFFKAPDFSRSWMNTTYYINRNTMEKTVRLGKGITGGSNIGFGIDNITEYFDTHYTNQEYADIFLNQVLETMLPEQPDAARYAYFQNKLLGGLSPVNWMFEWQNYKATGDDSAVSIVLWDLYYAIFKSPEFQTF
jgi:hypothetical protein